MFKGSYVAIVTPFDNGQVDEPRYKDLIEFQIAGGTHGIVACGSTGESATMTHDEHERVIDLAVETVNGRVTLIAGTGSNSTAEALRLTKHAKASGADGAMLITPYYNKPTQEGLYQHYKTIAEEVDIPIIVYNVPGRTGVNLLPETMARIGKIKNIVSLKDASGSLTQTMETVAACGSDITILSGEDALTFPMMAVGVKGVISVTANIAPREVADMVNAMEKGDVEKAREIHYKLLPLHNAMFYESNPIPVKTALALMGKITGEMRLPLCAISEANLKRLKKAMTDFGLLKG